MVGIPKWVSEGSVRKYHQAVTFVTKAGGEVTEDAIKARYIALKGLVLEGPEVVEDVVEEPKKKGKK
jgi:hypothetical protein